MVNFSIHPPRMKPLPLALIGLISTVTVAVNLHAAGRAPATSEVPDANLKELTDTTILTRRVWLETEWNKFRDGTHILEETLGGVVGVAGFGEPGLGCAAEAAAEVPLRQRCVWRSRHRRSGRYQARHRHCRAPEQDLAYRRRSRPANADRARGTAATTPGGFRSSWPWPGISPRG